MPLPPEDSRTAPPPADTHPGTAPAWEADRALVGRVLRGDPEAVEEFTRRMACLPPFLASRLRSTGRPLGDDDLPDLVQDVLVIVWRRLDSFAGRSTLETWACGIGLFEMRNAARRRRRRQDRERPLAGAEEPAPERPADDGLDVEALRLALGGLPDPDADLLRLKHREGLSFPELGQRLELSTSGAKNRYYRILERLRARLGGRSGPAEDGP